MAFWGQELREGLGTILGAILGQGWGQAWGQTFVWMDLLLVLLLFVLELVLSADNAAALALIVRKLPTKQRNYALFIGILSSFILRGAAIIAALYFIKLLWVQVLGGLYLVYLAFSHYRAAKQPEIAPGAFWKTVITIELTDLVFALDSIIAGVAVVGSYYERDVIFSKIWIIYLGAVLGMVSMRFLTTGVLYLMERFPFVEKIVFVLVALLGLRLALKGLFPLVKDFFIAV